MNIIEWISTNLRLSAAETAQLKLTGSQELKRCDELLSQLGLLSEDTAERLYIDYYQIPAVPDDISQFARSTPPPTGLNTDFLLKMQWLYMGNNDRGSVFSSPHPLQSEVLQYLALSGVDFQCYYAPEARFRKLLASHKRALHLRLSDDSDPEKTLALAEEAPTVNLVNSLISRSLRSGASDLHIEPYQSGYRARIRVDGIMSELDVLPAQLQLAAISRIKILSGMDISERRRPQDGKIEQEVDGEPLDIRVSSLPLGDGESVVMRFLSNESVSHDLDHVGLAPDIQKHLVRDLQRTSGVILMTGPTGSGKTTTLYALLNRLNTQQRKIITLEDPIEYSIEGINQMQVHPEIGFDFAAGLRSVVRQDPDIIMVGEIRDAETARIALQSAITGHLVFSTVHTNDAPGAFTRLVELGVEEHLINSGLVAIVAQRLVRRLCSSCKSSLSEAPEMLHNHLQKRTQQGQNVTLYQAEGCDLCNHSGYKGRIPITEYMPWDCDMMNIKKDAHFTNNATRALRERGFRSLYEDGIERVLNGETTLSEVIRVAG